MISPMNPSHGHIFRERAVAFLNRFIKIIEQTANLFIFSFTRLPTNVIIIIIKIPKYNGYYNRKDGHCIMMNTKILIIDDDPHISEAIRLYLEKEGHEIRNAYDGTEGVAMFKTTDPDLVLLDIMMPGKDGWQVCREIREISSKPIIMLTAKGEVFDKVLGLELGADDFLAKPVDMKELSARIKAVLRRCQANDAHGNDECVKFENIEISRQKYEVKVGGKVLDVPPKELELLYFLAANYNHVFTRDQLLDKVWGYDYLGDSRTVDVHIKRLREKLEGVSDKWNLKTVWGVGYKFEVLA